MTEKVKEVLRPVERDVSTCVCLFNNTLPKETDLIGSLMARGEEEEGEGGGGVCQRGDPCAGRANRRRRGGRGERHDEAGGQAGHQGLCAQRGDS